MRVRNCCNHFKAWITEHRAAERLAVRLDIDPVRNTPAPAPFHLAQCNFAFLRIKGYISPKFLLPKFHFDGRIIAVAGFPGSYLKDSVIRVIGVGLGHPSIFGNDFGTKHIAPGHLIRTNGRILAHSASTLKGSSGGPVFDPDTFQFVGIHIEGWDDVNWNIGLSVDHPVFRAAYNQFVLPTLPVNDQEVLRVINAV
jgi:hypothetical protein